jgi:tetratricopeptide (TPR) repeat protein
MTDTERVRSLLQQGIDHHNAGRLTEAGEIYLQVLTLEEAQPDALHLTGVVAHQLGRHDLAVQFICEAIVHEAGEPAFYNNLGTALTGVGNVEDAERAFAHAIQLRPDYAMAWFNAANLHESRGNHAAAVECRTRAVELDPSLETATSAAS